MTKLKRLGLMLFALIMAMQGSVCADTGKPTSKYIAVASRTGPEAIIVAASGDPQVKRMADWCRGYLKERGFAVRESTPSDSGSNHSPVWTLGVEGPSPIEAEASIDRSFLKRAKADAYILRVDVTKKGPAVLILGKNAAGVRAGVARLVALLRVDGDNLTAPIRTECQSPFFAVRELMVANRGKVFAGTQWEDTQWRRWSDERIRKYAEQIWLLGFNSLQTAEARSFRASTASKGRLDEVVHRTQVLMQAARDNGMLVSQMIWGQAPYNARLCWNTPSQRAIMEEEFRWMASTYGKYVDRVVVHVRDPGGCPRGVDCSACDDYKTPQEIANFIQKEYRKVNPKVMVTLSTWFNPNFWNGAPGIEFLDETYCPRDIGIALHKWYDPDKAKRVLKSGRSVDIWSWYLSDYETTSDMSLCMTKVDSFYSTLPEQASSEIRVISNELCFHGWPSILTAYVSAQKMWNPHRSLAAIEREYCAGMFGEANADAMVAVYQACELVVNPWRGDPRVPAIDKVFGNLEYNKQFRAALEAGRRVHLDPRVSPTFNTATSPQALVDYLLRNLSLVTVLSEAQEQINSAKAGGAGSEELNQIYNEALMRAEPYKGDIDYIGLTKRLKDSIAKRVPSVKPR